MDEIIELWKPIKDYESLYNVSNLGKIKNITNGRILKQTITHEGYLCVGLVAKRKIKSKLVHRLVGESFLKNHNNLPIIDHKDRNRANNCVNNLIWSTHKNNANNRGLRIKSETIQSNFTYDEIWINYDGYDISNWGRIKNRIGVIRNPIIGVDEKYPKVSMNSKRYRVHQLIAKLFIPNTNNHPLVLHKDDNPLNYGINNLYWGTHKMNMVDSHKNGRKKAIIIGDNISVFTVDIINEIVKKFESGYTIRGLSREYNIERTNISRLLNGKTYPELNINFTDVLNNRVDKIKKEAEFKKIKKESLKGIPYINPNRKLTDEQVIEIRNKIGIISQRKLAKIYNVSRAIIMHIKTGRCYRSVKS
jgi:hypothetical protein